MVQINKQITLTSTFTLKIYSLMFTIALSFGNISDNMTIQGIQDKIRKGDYGFSEHAVKRMIKRAISRQEVEEAVLRGEIIDEYPEDKYSPSCLVYGKTEKGRDLHVQVSLPPVVVVITAYDPDPKEWIDFKIRR